MNIAIVAVAYNRVNSLQRLLHSLENAYYAEKVTLIISIDKSNTDIVEHFADNYLWPHGEKIVDKHDKNLGLRPHMLSLGKWFETFDAIVVLEDDIVVSPNYFTYTYKAVNTYSLCPEIAGISLYSFCVNYQNGLPFIPLKDENDVYFMNCAMSWGEVWMRDSWNRFYNWYLEHKEFTAEYYLPTRICRWNQKSWLKYHTRYCIEENKYFVHPYISLSSNFGDAGEHNNEGGYTAYQVELQQGIKENFVFPEFGVNGVYYDGFFENKALYKHLGLGDDDLCLDLQGEWRNRLNKRYWLTTEVRNYKIVKSFGLNYRPIELNVLLNNEGGQIFLYDTQSSENNPYSARISDLLYRYRVNNIAILIIKYGLLSTWNDCVKLLKQRIRLKFKKKK